MSSLEVNGDTTAKANLGALSSGISKVVPEVRAAIEFDTIRVYINGLLHIDVQRSELFGIGTWRWRDGYFGIEFISQSGARVKTEYETEALFKAVLGELQKLPLHGE